MSQRPGIPCPSALRESVGPFLPIQGFGTAGSQPDPGPLLSCLLCGRQLDTKSTLFLPKARFICAAGFQGLTKYEAFLVSGSYDVFIHCRNTAF